MKRILNSVMKALLISTLLVVALSGTVLAEDGTIDMVVSPQVLNIESNGGSISIHTNIGFVSIADTTVEVDGKEIKVEATFTDNCGNLVVKCDIDEVKGIVINDESAVFVLACNYSDGVYTGSDSVPVIRVIPQKP